jgi:hypothetical protein
MTRQTRSLSVVGLVCAALFCTALSAQVCFEPGPTPGWAPFDIGEVLNGSSRPSPAPLAGYELCSISEGYGVDVGNDKSTDSFRFLFRLMRAHWRITGTLLQLEGGGHAGLDARVHQGSSLLETLPYVGITARSSATGGMTLHSSFRTEVLGDAVSADGPTVAVQLPIFLRIEREGDTITTSYSSDGGTYTPHLTMQTAGTGLNQQNFRVGMTQASTLQRSSSASFGAVEGLVLEDRRPPTISRVDPNIGPLAGGTVVTIAGDRLAETVGVTIGGVPAEIQGITDEAVLVKVGGTETDIVGDVVVETSTGVSSLPNGFTLAGGPFLRSDCNGDGVADISDSIAFLQWLFRGGIPCQCFEAADVNADRALDITDAIYSLAHIFRGSADPPGPYPLAGFPAGPFVPCGVPALSFRNKVDIVLPQGAQGLREGDVFELIGGDFPTDPSEMKIFLGSTPTEILDISGGGGGTGKRITARVGLVVESIARAEVSMVFPGKLLLSQAFCKLKKCSPFPVVIGDLAELRVTLIASDRVLPLGSSRGTSFDGLRTREIVIPFDSQNLESDGIVGVMGNLMLPPVSGEEGLSRGSQIIDLQLRVRGKPSQEDLGNQVAEAIQDQLTGGGAAREVGVTFDPSREAIVLQLDSKLGDFLEERNLHPAFDFSIYGLGRPPPCTCVADLDEDGVDESYTPLVDDRGYAWCRLYHLWKKCGGLPTWEYFLPRNCVYIESGTTCESDGFNTYPVFPLPHPHSIAPIPKSTMFNRDAYCHIRRHKLWNNCKLLDLELLGDTQVPHFPRSAVVLKTEWRTNPPGPDSQYYSYPYDNGTTTTDEYLVAWHFTDKCIDKWTWCDLYIPTSQGGLGGCGGSNADRPPALDGLGIDDYYMCINVRDTDSITSCGNEFFPECDNSNCMSCHSPAGDGVVQFISGADSAWVGGLGTGLLGSDFLYSLTSGPAVPTGGLSGANPACQ